jgi:hypothetical protein
MDTYLQLTLDHGDFFRRELQLQGPCQFAKPGQKNIRISVGYEYRYVSSTVLVRTSTGRPLTLLEHGRQSLKLKFFVWRPRPQTARRSLSFRPSPKLRGGWVGSSEEESELLRLSRRVFTRLHHESNMRQFLMAFLISWVRSSVQVQERK